MGAKIGPNVHLANDAFAIYDLLAIGEDSSINADSNLLGYTIEDGLLKIGSITIGKRCFVGARACLRENTVMEDDSALEDLSLLPRGASFRAEKRGLARRPTEWSRRPAWPPSPSAPASATSDDSPPLRLRCAAWHRPADLPGARGRGPVPRHRVDEPVELPRPVLLVPAAGAAGRRFIHHIAGLGNRRREMAAAGESEAGALSAAQLVLPAQVVRGPDPGPEPRHPRAALRLGLSDAVVSAAGRQAGLWGGSLHRLIHLARPPVHRRRELHRRQRVARRAAQCAAAP